MSCELRSQCEECSLPLGNSRLEQQEENPPEEAVDEFITPPEELPPQQCSNTRMPAFLKASNIDLTGRTAVFCVVLALVIMFSLALILQVYLMHVTTYHDTLFLKLEEAEDSERHDSPDVSGNILRKTAQTVLWKINPGHATRPPMSSSRPRVYWNIARRAGSSVISDPNTRNKKRRFTTRRQQIIRDFPLLLPEDYQGIRKSVCMFHAAVAGRIRNGLRYDAGAFPYHLCTHIIYCCVGISKDLEVTSRHLDVDVTEGSLETFASLKNKNPDLRVYIGFGGNDKDKAGFSRIAASVGARQRFALGAVDWMRRFRYDGMVFYWKYPFLDQRIQLVDTIKYLRRMLKDVNLSTAIVVPLDEMLRNRFDIRELASSLDNYTVLVDPIETHGVSYDSTFVPLRDATIRLYAGLFMTTLLKSKGLVSDGRFKLCYLLPLHALSFTLEEPAQTEINSPTLGPGEAGISTDQPGYLSYDEVCNERWEDSRRVNYGIVSTKANQWVVYQNRSSLREFITALGLVTGSAKCVGIWDPSWDDFSGVCGEGPYPLSRAVFAKVIGRKILHRATTKAHYVL